MSSSTPNEELKKLRAKGGKAVTDKKREHLRKALAALWAKAKKKSEA